MSIRRPPRPRLLVAVVLALAGLSLSACREVEEEAAAGYEPATVSSVKGSDDLKKVTLTREGEQRIGLELEAVRARGAHKTVPYASLIYDAEGATWVYTSPKPLTFVRREVDVENIDGDVVLLEEGPPAGTKVLTVGAAEVHGAELEIAESH